MLLHNLTAPDSSQLRWAGSHKRPEKRSDPLNPEASLPNQTLNPTVGPGLVGAPSIKSKGRAIQDTLTVWGCAVKSSGRRKIFFSGIAAPFINLHKLLAITLI